MAVFSDNFSTLQKKITTSLYTIITSINTCDICVYINMNIVVWTLKNWRHNHSKVIYCLKRKNRTSSL